MAFLPSSVDYWRIYDVGIAAIAQSYWEDIAQARDDAGPCLRVHAVLWRIHSLLAHARLAGRETPGARQVLIRTEWNGLVGRALKFPRAKPLEHLLHDRARPD